MNVRLVLGYTALLGSVTGAAQAPAVGAQLASAEGLVELHRPTDPQPTWRPVTESIPLLQGDLVRTGPTGTATVIAADGTVYQIGRSTLYHVGIPSNSDVSEASSAPARPPGVASDRWLALGPDAGVVLSTGSAVAGASLEGTLYARRDGSWVRIHLTAPPGNPRQVVPAK